MPQEQLLQRRRLAGQAQHPGGGEVPQSSSSRAGVHLAPHPGALPAEVLHVQVMHAARSPARRAAWPARRRSRSWSGAQPGERAGFPPCGRPDDRHRSQSASTSDRMWLDSSTVRPCLPFLLNAVAERGLHQRVEAGRGLIQEQHSTSDASAEIRQPSAGCLGVRPRLLGRVQVEALEQAGPAAGVQSAAQPPEQVDDLSAGQGRPEASTSPGTYASLRCSEVASRHGSPPSSRAVPPSARSRPSRILIVVVLPDRSARGSRAPRRPFTVRSSASSAQARPKDFAQAGDFDGGRHSPVLYT